MTTVLEPPLAAPRGLTPVPVDAALSRTVQRGFGVLNRYLTLPVMHLGLGPWMHTPLGGWILVLRVRGRKSGITRETPLSYLVADGAVWVMSGFGTRGEWYRNLLADPAVEVLLPGRSFACRAEVVDDQPTRQRIIPRLIRATGLPGFLTGVNPYRATDQELVDVAASIPLIRLRPAGEPVVAGPDDPGGLGWVWRQAAVLLVGSLLVRKLSARLRG
jgi:deazaflavin-dependent oxidoreductase (nitroreductase family)